MDPLVSSITLLLIVITAIGLILGIGLPAIDASKDSMNFREAEQTLRLIDNYIREIVSEGNQSSREIILDLSSRNFEVLPDEDSIQFSLLSSANLLDYFTRKEVGDMIYIAGNDVNCSVINDNLIIENTYLKVVFQYIPSLSNIDTKNNILYLEEKILGNRIYLSDSSVEIDENSSSGTGFTEILAAGTNLPECTVHVFVNSTLSYDVYYTLYSGADFLVIDVKGIR